MAKKKKSKQSLLYQKQQQKAKRPASRLQEAQQALHNNDLARALVLSEGALRAANDVDTTRQAKELVTEVRFRLAANSPIPAETLRHLDAAIALAPAQPRLHYHHGLTLWRMGDLAKAQAALEKVASQDPKRPGIPYLRELGRLMQKEPFKGEQLSSSERSTLQLLQQISKTANLDDVAATAIEQPLLGNNPRLWSLLLQMAANPKSAPVVELSKAVENSNGSGNPILAYYQGVAAMRKGDITQALTAWRHSSQTIITPWLQENLLHSRREIALELAQQEKWQEIAKLYEATAIEVESHQIDEVFAEIAGVAYYHLGYADAEAKRWPEAARHWQAGSAISKRRDLLQNLALAEESLGHWDEAAQAWREMVRRRPRKEDHPDYLTDGQVAAIWSHAADCYEQVEQVEEVVTCLKNAIKYAPDDTELRVKLADALLGDGRHEAAENELERIVQVDPNHVPTLTRLAMIYSEGWEHDPLPIWQRVLTLEPHNTDARQALTMIYIGKARGEPDLYRYGFHFDGRRRTIKDSIKIIEEGLQVLPGEPRLLIELGMFYREQKQKAKATEQFQAALRNAPRDLMVIGIAMHELLHVDADKQVREMAPQISQMQGLQAAFWLDQADRVINCELGISRAEFFWDEAIRMVEQTPASGSLPATLLKAHEAALRNQAPKVAEKYGQRLRTNHAQSGAVEYMDALQMHDKNPNKKAPVLSLLRKATANAQKAKEPAILKMIEEYEQFIQRPRLPNLFGGLDLDLFRELFDSLDEDELDVFKRRRF
jgi:tetratricopeptide (TPR) repeat protein